MSCPMKCELCNSFCAVADHFHPLEKDAVHLCGSVYYIITSSHLMPLPGRDMSVATSVNDLEYVRLRQLHSQLSPHLLGSTLHINIQRWISHLSNARILTRHLSSPRRLVDCLAQFHSNQINESMKVLMCTHWSPIFITAKSAASIVATIAPYHSARSISFRYCTC